MADGCLTDMEFVMLRDEFFFLFLSLFFAGLFRILGFYKTWACRICSPVSSLADGW